MNLLENGWTLPLTGTSGTATKERGWKAGYAGKSDIDSMRLFVNIVIALYGNVIMLLCSVSVVVANC